METYRREKRACILIKVIEIRSEKKRTVQSKIYRSKEADTTRQKTMD